MTLNDYFDKILIINLDRRADRWQHASDQCTKHNIAAERIPGVEMPKWENNGCVAAHRKVLDVISYMKWPRTLVLEDDFLCRFDDMQQRFSDMIGEVPKDWDLLYLGGHYMENPRARISQHVIRINRMFTTSSYGITLAQAEKMAPHIAGMGPIDTLYGNFNLSDNCYIFQPRLMVQYDNFSDIQQKVLNHGPCMEDVSHENTV